MSPERGAAPTATAYFIIAGFALARLAFAASLGLGVDESYTIVIARQLSLSYFDHPPLHLWIAHAAALIFGESVAIRLPFVALFAVTGWLIFLMSRRLFGPRAALIALFCLNATPFFFASAGAWVVPDGPMLCALSAAALLLTTLFFEPVEAARRWRLWLGVGLALGLAGLAKYNAIFFPLGLLIFILGAPSQRHWLRSGAPYVSAALALLLLAPVLIWNAQHDWISFNFQSARGALSGHWRPDQSLTMLAGEAAFLAPWLFAPLAAALIGAIWAGRRDERQFFLVCLALPAILFFTLAPLWGQRGLPHWPMPGWIFVYPLMGAWLDKGWARMRDLRLYGAVCAGLLGALALLVVSQASSGWLTPNAWPAADPTLETLSWAPIGNAAAFSAKLAPAPAFVVATKWSDGGKVGLALGPQMPVLIFSDDPRGLAFAADPNNFLSEDGVIIVPQSRAQATRDALAPYFESLGATQTIELMRGGKIALSLAAIPARVLTHRFAAPYPR